MQSGKSFTPNAIELYFDEYQQKHTIICSRCSKATCEGDVFCCDSARNMFDDYLAPAIDWHLVSIWDKAQPKPLIPNNFGLTHHN